MKRAAWLIFTFLIMPLLPTAQALTPTRSEVTLGQKTGLKTCTVSVTTGLHKGQIWRLTLQGGHLRFAQYGHRYPDNTLRVRQSYDRAGRLTGVSVVVTGFAGPLLNVRAAANAKGRLLSEKGFRRAGFTTPLQSYVQVAPKSCSGS